MAEACNRLIKNSIICWNYLYLARPIEKATDAETRENLRCTIATHSPMSGTISTCLANTISPTKNSGMPSESCP
ncbi:MAG: hypothetical protein IPL99_24085 [Candidatus Competibacteraceae bacterium]|nr:hypothetical protein [Candidatus Competibacteraceae bacterium]